MVSWSTLSTVLMMLWSIVIPAQAEKMRAELASLNPCAVRFLNRAVVKLRWYYYTLSAVLMMLWSTLRSVITHKDLIKCTKFSDIKSQRC